MTPSFCPSDYPCLTPHSVRKRNLPVFGIRRKVVRQSRNRPSALKAETAYKRLLFTPLPQCRGMGHTEASDARASTHNATNIQS